MSETFSELFGIEFLTPKLYNYVGNDFWAQGCMQSPVLPSKSPQRKHF